MRYLAAAVSLLVAAFAWLAPQATLTEEKQSVIQSMQLGELVKPPLLPLPLFPPSLTTPLHTMDDLQLLNVVQGVEG